MCVVSFFVVVVAYSLIYWTAIFLFYLFIFVLFFVVEATHPLTHEAANLVIYFYITIIIIIFPSLRRPHTLQSRWQQFLFLKKSSKFKLFWIFLMFSFVAAASHPLLTKRPKEECISLFFKFFCQVCFLSLWRPQSYLQL